MSKENEQKKEPKIDRKLLMVLAIGALGLGTMLANRSLDAGAEVQIPFTNVHVAVGAGIGPKEKLTQALPAWAIERMGANANQSDIFNVDPGLNAGDFGAFFFFDIRNKPNDPILDAGVGTSG